MFDKNAAIRQRYAIALQNEKRIKAVCPTVNDGCGIYAFFRTDEDGFRFAYVGQAKHVLSRLASHLSGYNQHIDLSLRKHKLYDAEKNPHGWQVTVCTNCAASELDATERQFIKLYADNGYQLLNKTTGSQGGDKTALGATKTPKGYYDGLRQGERNTQRKIANWFDKSLDYSIKGKPNANKQKAYDRFAEFLQGDKEEGQEQ